MTGQRTRESFSPRSFAGAAVSESRVATRYPSTEPICRPSPRRDSQESEFNHIGGDASVVVQGAA